jgi:hypothetical protein
MIKSLTFRPKDFSSFEMVDGLLGEVRLVKQDPNLFTMLLKHNVDVT